MGYGGALIWTGLTRNLKQHWPEKQVVLVQPRSLKQFLARKPYSTNVVYQNNPDIGLLTDDLNWLWQRWRFKPHQIIVVRMRRPEYKYWTKETPERIYYRSGKHAIQMAADVHGISKAHLQPRIELTDAEQHHVRTVLQSHGLIDVPFICIEPHSNTTYTPNKAWFWDRWQAVVTKLHDYFHAQQMDWRIAQIGVPHNKVLAGVTNLTGTTSFRETAGILQHAQLFVGCIGGLVHLSRAVGTRNVVLVSGFEPVELATYPSDINLHVPMDCQCQGLKTPCPIGREAMRQIAIDDVVQAVVQGVKERHG